MKYTTALFLLYLFPFLSRANDGAFRAEGNHLIPMYETDISVKKEILTISRINLTQARIEVYYEFYNPKDAKALEVGFEAYSPSGDASKTPVDDGRHPYISQFTVSLNDEAVPYKVSIVHDSLYYRNGQYKALPVAKAIKQSQEDDEVDFFYVYHFRAAFKHGINHLRHVYIVDLSSSYYYRSQDTDDVDGMESSEKFDCKRDRLPFSIDRQAEILPPANDLSRKILHNLAFARRGYVFKSPELASYYERLKWYAPNPAYTPVLSELSKKEQDYLLKNK